MDTAEITTMVRLKTLLVTGEVTDAEILTLINDCIFHVSQVMDAPWLETQENLATVAGTQSYLLSTFTGEVEQITAIREDAVNRELVPVSRDFAHRTWGDNVNQSRPRFYYIDQESIFMVPVPDSVRTYHVSFVKAPTALTAGQSPLWLTSFHNIAVDYVEARLWEREEDYEKAAFAQAKFDSRLRAMRQAYQERSGYRPWSLGTGSEAQRRTNVPFIDDWGSA